MRYYKKTAQTTPSVKSKIIEDLKKQLATAEMTGASFQELYGYEPTPYPPAHSQKYDKYKYNDKYAYKAKSYYDDYWASNKSVAYVDYENTYTKYLQEKELMMKYSIDPYVPAKPKFK